MADYLTARELEPGLRVLLAPNPSPLTYEGTNTYVIGSDRVVVVDPGPDNAEHLSAIIKAIKGAIVEAVLVTHSHLDHSPLAAKLGAQVGAPVVAFGGSVAGQSEHMAALAASGEIGGGEGVETGFKPDGTLADQEVLDCGGFQISAIHTPGHMSNHLSFSVDDILLTGDHVMGWASSLISPPDGDLTAFMASCRRLQNRADRIYYPGHGAAVTDPSERVEWLIDHRLGREAQILNALSDPATPPVLTRRVYTDIKPRLFPAAERNVLAHLIDLAQRGTISVDGPHSMMANYALSPK